MNSKFPIKNLLLVGSVIAVLVTIGVLSSGGRANIDTPDEGSSIDYSTQVRMVNGKDLLYAIGGVRPYDFLGKDLFTFGKVGYTKYKSGGVIGFEVTSNLKEDGNTINFSGRFGATDNKIDVTVKTLKNDRIHTSITDTVTKLNIDDELPSNTIRNQFIGSLPLNDKRYSIEYMRSKDSFLINIFNSKENLKLAEQALMDGLEIKSLESENVVRYGAFESAPEVWF